MRGQLIILWVSAICLVVSGCGKKEDGAKTPPVKTPPKKVNTYKESGVTNGGSVTGTVTYAGSAVDTTVDVTEKACAEGKAAEGAIVLAKGMLKNAVVALQGLKEGKKWASDTITVDNKNCSFEPRISIAKLGGNIAATNSDQAAHNTNLTFGGPVDNQSLDPGGKGKTLNTKRIRKPGVVTVACNMHNWMKGAIYVSDHPYVTTTAADGRFTIADVPAGKYTAKVWHEKLGEQTAEVTVEAGKAATLNFDLK